MQVIFSIRIVIIEHPPSEHDRLHVVYQVQRLQKELNIKLDKKITCKYITRICTSTTENRIQHTQ